MTNTWVRDQRFTQEWNQRVKCPFINSEQGEEVAFSRTYYVLQFYVRAISLSVFL